MEDDLKYFQFFLSIYLLVRLKASYIPKISFLDGPEFFSRKDRPTDRPTDKATYRSSQPELKNNFEDNLNILLGLFKRNSFEDNLIIYYIFE